MDEGMELSGRIVRHIKSGGEYVVIDDDALIEATMGRAVFYRSVVNGKGWVRPYEEFVDGRFELTE